MYIPQSSALINSRNSFIPLSRIRDSRAKEIHARYIGPERKVKLFWRSGGEVGRKIRGKNLQKGIFLCMISTGRVEGASEGGNTGWWLIKPGMLIALALGKSSHHPLLAKWPCISHTSIRTYANTHAKHVRGLRVDRPSADRKSWRCNVRLLHSH